MIRNRFSYETDLVAPRLLQFEVPLIGAAVCTLIFRRLPLREESGGDLCQKQKKARLYLC